MVDANDILNETETQHERVKPHLRDVADWFHDQEGEMFTRTEATNSIRDDLKLDDNIARDTVRALVCDSVDPIVQVQTNDEKYIGVVEFKEFDGAYGYIDYHDVYGKRPKVVCAQCVQEVTYDEEATHAAAGKGSHNADATYNDLLEAIHEHYEYHDERPENVETGASLVSGTTIAGNTAWHAGNDGSGSGLDADTLDGQQASDLDTETATVNFGDPSDGTRTSQSTSLSGEPDQLSLYLKCTSAELGFNVGDKVEGPFTGYDGTLSSGLVGWANGSTLGYESSSGGIKLPDSNGDSVTITSSNWEVMVEAVKF